MWNASRFCVSSLRRGHANLLCIVPILVYVLPKQVQKLIFYYFVIYESIVHATTCERCRPDESLPWPSDGRKSKRAIKPNVAAVTWRQDGVKAILKAGSCNHGLISSTTTSSYTHYNLTEPNGLRLPQGFANVTSGRTPKRKFNAAAGSWLYLTEKTLAQSWCTI